MAVNAFVSVINCGVSHDCPLCINRETVSLFHGVLSAAATVCNVGKSFWMVWESFFSTHVHSGLQVLSEEQRQMPAF